MRFAPVLLWSVAPLSLACTSGPRVLNIEVTTGYETDAMRESPPVARVTVKGSTPEGQVISAEAAPGGSLDFGDVDGDLAYQFEVTGTDGEGNTVLRGRSIGGIVLSGVQSDTVTLFAQRLGQWARAPGALAHSHAHAPALFVGGRYLFMTGGDGGAAAAGTEEYDMFAWAGATGTTFPWAAQTLAPQADQVLAVGSEAVWFDGATFSDPYPYPSAGLKSFDEVGGGAVVVASDGRAFVVGGTRLDRPTDAVLEIGTDLSITVRRMAFARAGASAMWLEDVGLVVLGGSAEGPAVELLPAQGTVFTARDFPPDPTSGAAAVVTNVQTVALIGGTNGGAAAKTRILDPRCTSNCAVKEVDGATPETALSRAAGFALPNGRAIVVGDEAAPDGKGMTRAFVIDYLSPVVTELPLREPRWGATLVDTPNGQFAVMGGMHADGTEALSVEMFFPE